MHTSYLKYFVGLSLAAVLILPTYLYWSVAPQFKDLIIENTEREAERVSNHLVSMFQLAGKKEIDRDVQGILEERDKKLREEFQVEKIKLFRANGEILFSSDSKNIGTINQKSYFKDVVAQGNKFTKLVEKDHKTAEGRVVKVDVLEIYVPILSDKEFIGAFEIYYDISEAKDRLDTLLMQVYFVLLLVSGVLLLALFVIFDRASKSIADRKKADAQREKLITSLREALEEIKALQGIIPICSFCKQIRDDEGFWQQVDHYIGEHSEAQFSHSVCPKCMKENYPEFSDSEDLFI
jgi:sensor histidine kinase regulating citrate/malate metabolism